MEYGAVFPQTEIGTNIELLKNYVREIEAMSFDQMVAFDHVIGKKIESSEIGDFSRYTNEHSFYEPLTLFSFAAGLTDRLKFMSGVIILPQRQTALVAKQAATLDVLSGERLSLGFGVGYNDYEFAAMGVPFTQRGERLEQQIEIMRRLWAQDLVDIDVPDCKIQNAGINPRPKRGRIPVLVGAMVKGGMQRAARIGDGWLSPHWELDQIAGRVREMETYLEAAGRSRSDYTISALILCRQMGSDIGLAASEQAVGFVHAWQDAGADMVAVDTAFVGLRACDEHLELLRRIKEKV